MAMPDGLGSMLGETAAKKGAAYIPYIGQAYQAYNIYKGFRKGGIKGAISSLIPFGGSIFGGGGGSRRNAMARQYLALVNQFDKEFLKPTISSMGDVKRDVPRGSVRIGNEPFRNILTQFEGAGKSLRSMVSKGNFGSISERINELSGLAKAVRGELGKRVGGRGAGPDIPSRPISGLQNIPISNIELEKPVLDLPGAYHGGVYSPVKSEGHRFPVTTTQTPGGKRRKIGFGETPGILT